MPFCLFKVHISGNGLIVGGLTPGITRRPERLQEFGKLRVDGQVHAIVRCRADHSPAGCADSQVLYAARR